MFGAFELCVVYFLFPTTPATIFDLFLHLRIGLAYSDYDIDDTNDSPQREPRTTDFAITTRIMETLRCVNCGISTFHRQIHHLETEAVQSIVVGERILKKLI